MFNLRKHGFILLAACAYQMLWAGPRGLEGGKTVTFRFVGDSTTQTVSVLGDFNNWQKDADALSDEDGDGVWTKKKFLAYGRYEYRFLINGSRYLRDPANLVFAGSHSNSILFVDAPETPHLQVLAPLPGEMISRLPFRIEVSFQPGRQTDKMDKKRSQLKIDGKRVRTEFDFQKQVVYASLPELSEGLHRLWVRLWDKKGNATRPDSLIFVVNARNGPPEAEAGYTLFAVPQSPATLNGGLSHDEDYDPIRKFAWQFIPSYSSFPMPDTAIASMPFSTVVFPDTGQYLFSLKTYDGQLWSAPDTAEVIVRKRFQNEVTFSLDARRLPNLAITRVSVAGEFNHWNKTALPLQDDDGDGKWKAAAVLRPGEYEYKFVVNDSLWLADPANPRRISDGWNGFNSVLTVPRSVSRKLRLRWKLTADTLQWVVDSARSSLKWQFYRDINNPGDKARLPEFSGKFPLREALPGNHFYYARADSQGLEVFGQTALISYSGFNQLTSLNFDVAPGWPRSTIAYQIFVRNFGADSSRSGTIQDVIARLDYLQDLGVNCIWLMPIMESNSEHGYTPVDFFSVEKDYGTLEDYAQLVREVHARNMRIIFDFVANHTSDQHPFFLSAWRNPASLFRDWYVWSGRFSYAYHNDWDQLPNLNYDNPNVRRFILKVADFWMGQGVDGFRCDAAWGVPHDFWKNFRRRVKSRNPQFVLLDEVLPRDVSFHDNEFDMSYDTDFYGNVLDVFRGSKPLDALTYGMRKTRLNYPPGIVDLRYIENQDLPRFIAQFGEPATRVAAALLLTVPGMPLIYYGQELGLRNMRPAMRWDAVGSPLYQFYRELIQLRRAYEALRTGNMEFLANSAPGSVLTYQRQKGGDRILVALNFKQKPVDVTIDRRDFSRAVRLFAYPQGTANALRNPVHLAGYEIQIWRL